MNQDKALPLEQEKQEEKRPYGPPAIIYSGQISTRAGSPIGSPSDSEGIDPADLFGD